MQQPDYLLQRQMGRKCQLVLCLSQAQWAASVVVVVVVVGGGGGGGGSSSPFHPPFQSPAPLLLHGYGAYGVCEDPAFSSEALSLCDRGFVCATAHVRGGSEQGRLWYEKGKLGHKMNSVTDFIAVAETLCALGWTSPDRLVAEGGSAGGLLVGAAVNARPQLWRGCLLRVPFLDVLATMADKSLPLVSAEVEEWGDPYVDSFELIKSYCPMQNIKKSPYPPALVTTALNDDRVGYWEAAKWVQRVRGVSSSKQLLKCELEEGHGGATDRYKGIRDAAFELAWVLDCVGAGGEASKAKAKRSGED